MGKWSKPHPMHGHKRFPERDAEIALRYADGAPITEIAGIYGITKQRVQQILVRAGHQMRPRGRHTNMFYAARQRQEAAA